MREKALNCPNCGFNPVDLTVENGQMIFLCEDCDWQKVEENYFYLAGWEVEIRQALAPIDILQSLLTDTDTAKFLRPRIKGPSYLSNYKDASDKYLFGEIKIAHQVYLRQMIVLATTYVELILKDFFRCLFIAHPLRMNTYLSAEGKGKAMIALNEVITAPSREEILLSLAERAASIAVGPKFDKVIEMIIKESKLKLDRPVVDDLRTLNELRNRIIHQGAPEEIDIQQVHNNFGLLIYLVYILAQAAEAYRIPYFDEFGFIDDFEKQLQVDQKDGLAG